MDRFLVNRLEPGQFGFGKHDVLVRLVGVPLDDLLGRHGAVLGAPLAVLDPLAAAGVELP